jgi:hypothetical protein
VSSAIGSGGSGGVVEVEPSACIICWSNRPSVRFFAMCPGSRRRTCIQGGQAGRRQAGNLAPSHHRTGQVGRRQAGNEGAGRQQKAKRAVFKSKTAILASETARKARLQAQRREYSCT